MATRPKYMDNLTRKECSNIFNTRARIIQIKGNYRNRYINMACRWCNEDEETQLHTLKYCPEFKHLTNNQHEIYYQDDKDSTRATANILQGVIEKIDKITTLTQPQIT